MKLAVLFYLVATVFVLFLHSDFKYRLAGAFSYGYFYLKCRGNVSELFWAFVALIFLICFWWLLLLGVFIERLIVRKNKKFKM